MEHEKDRRRQSTTLFDNWEHVSSDSNLSLPYEYLDTTMKVPQVIIWELQTHFSKSVN